jgi:hypothetical protein
MIVFRRADPRLPFVREDAGQPAARWNGEGEGPVNYFADGAWAEFLRHEEIRTPDDLGTIRRAIWAVDIGDEPASVPNLPHATMTGGADTYPACREAARRLQSRGATRIEAPSAALVAGGARGHRVEGGLRHGPPREGRTIALFGPRPDAVGWRAAYEANPAPELLARVRWRS